MSSDVGRHNSDLVKSRDRLIRGDTYKDLSTVCIVPTRGVIAAKVVQSWLSMMTAMNQKFTRLFVEKMEVADAYNAGVSAVLENAELKKWRYVLTLEEDNLPQPDSLLRLYSAMEAKTDLGHKPDVVQGLYWTKGEGGQPMIYGDPRVSPRNYIPQLPKIDCLQECNGLGMGFTLFKLKMFKEIPRPWFRTVQEYKHGEGARVGTQDLFFFDSAAKYGNRFACDTRVKIGHYDLASDTVW